MVFLKFITCNNLYSYGNEDHVIPLHENTIIAGPNNSGKSNILRMLRLLIRSLKNGYNLQDYEMFDPNVDSYLELRLNLSYEEAKKIADFFSFYAEKHGTGNNKFYTFGDKKSLVNILKQLKIRITWQQQLYKVDRKAKVSFEFENIGLFLFGQTLSFELTAINALDKEQELQKEMADTRIQDVLEAASMSSIPDAKVRNIFESHADQFLKTDVLKAAKKHGS